jgi:hypothetical protein
MLPLPLPLLLLLPLLLFLSGACFVWPLPRRLLPWHWFYSSVTPLLLLLPLPLLLLLFCSEVMLYGHYRGFCSLGIVFQTMDNPHLRRALGMAAHQSGVLINRIQPTTSTAQVQPVTCVQYVLSIVSYYKMVVGFVAVGRGFLVHLPWLQTSRELRSTAFSQPPALPRCGYGVFVQLLDSGGVSWD